MLIGVFEMPLGDPNSRTYWFASFRCAGERASKESGERQPSGPFEERTELFGKLCELPFDFYLSFGFLFGSAIASRPPF